MYCPFLPTACASIATMCQHRLGILKWTKQVWTGIHWLPPDFTRRGWGRSLHCKFPCLQEDWATGPEEVPCTVRPNESWVMATVHRQTHTSENIALPQPLWRATNITDSESPMNCEILVCICFVRISCTNLYLLKFLPYVDLLVEKSIHEHCT